MNRSSGYIPFQNRDFSELKHVENASGGVELQANKKKMSDSIARIQQ
jgi:hypothetical protein